MSSIRCRHSRTCASALMTCILAITLPSLSLWNSKGYVLIADAASVSQSSSVSVSPGTRQVTISHTNTGSLSEFCVNITGAGQGSGQPWANDFTTSQCSMSQSITINQLEEYTNYTATAWQRDAAPPYTDFFFTTLAAAPSAPVSQLQLDRVFCNLQNVPKPHVLARWMPLAGRDWNGPSHKYKFFWELENSDVIFEQGANVTAIVFNTGYSEASLTLAIQPINEKGAGPFSNMTSYISSPTQYHQSCSDLVKAVSHKPSATSLPLTTTRVTTTAMPTTMQTHAPTNAPQPSTQAPQTTSPVPPSTTAAATTEPPATTGPPAKTDAPPKADAPTTMQTQAPTQAPQTTSSVPTITTTAATTEPPATTGPQAKTNAPPKTDAPATMQTQAPTQASQTITPVPSSTTTAAAATKLPAITSTSVKTDVPQRTDAPSTVQPASPKAEPNSDKINVFFTSSSVVMVSWLPIVMRDSSNMVYVVVACPKDLAQDCKRVTVGPKINSTEISGVSKGIEHTFVVAPVIATELGTVPDRQLINIKGSRSFDYVPTVDDPSKGSAISAALIGIVAGSAALVLAALGYLLFKRITSGPKRSQSSVNLGGQLAWPNEASHHLGVGSKVATALLEEEEYALVDEKARGKLASSNMGGENYETCETPLPMEYAFVGDSSANTSTCSTPGSKDGVPRGMDCGNQALAPGISLRHSGLSTSSSTATNLDVSCSRVGVRGIASDPFSMRSYAELLKHSAAPHKPITSSDVEHGEHITSASSSGRDSSTVDEATRNMPASEPISMTGMDEDQYSIMDGDTRHGRSESCYSDLQRSPSLSPARCKRISTIRRPVETASVMGAVICCRQGSQVTLCAMTALAKDNTAEQAFSLPSKATLDASTVSWSHNGIAVTPGCGDFARFDITQEGDLQISSIGVKDGGNFICVHRGSGDAANQGTRTGHLTVIVEDGQTGCTEESREGDVYSVCYGVVGDGCGNIPSSPVAASEGINSPAPDSVQRKMASRQNSANPLVYSQAVNLSDAPENALPQMKISQVQAVDSDATQRPGPSGNSPTQHGEMEVPPDSPSMHHRYSAVQHNRQGTAGLDSNQQASLLNLGAPNTDSTTVEGAFGNGSNTTGHDQQQPLSIDSVMDYSNCVNCPTADDGYLKAQDKPQARKRLSVASEEFYATA